MAEGDAAPALGAFGYVLPHEEREAKELIDKQFIELTGKPFGAKVCGYLVCIKIYVRPEHIREVKVDGGGTQKIYIPDQSRQEDRFQSVAGLVVGIGPQAYRGKNADGSEKFPEGPWCRVGDWVTIPRYEAHLFSYRGVALGIIVDDKIMSIIEDPTDVQNINAATKY